MSHVKVSLYCKTSLWRWTVIDWLSWWFCYSKLLPRDLKQSVSWESEYGWHWLHQTEPSKHFIDKDSQWLSVFVCVVEVCGLYIKWFSFEFLSVCLTQAFFSFFRPLICCFKQLNSNRFLCKVGICLEVSCKLPTFVWGGSSLKLLERSLRTDRMTGWSGINSYQFLVACLKPPTACGPCSLGCHTNCYKPKQLQRSSKRSHTKCLTSGFSVIGAALLAHWLFDLYGHKKPNPVINNV